MIFYILIGVTIFTARMGELLGLFNEMSDARKFKKMLKRGMCMYVYCITHTHIYAVKYTYVHILYAYMDICVYFILYIYMI